MKSKVSHKVYLSEIYSVLNVILSKRTKLFLACLPFLAIVSAVFEVGTVGMLIPFIQSITNPESLETLTVLKKIMSFFSVPIKNIIFVVQTAFFSFILISGFTRIFNNYIFQFIIAKVGTELANYGVNKILSNSYESHIQVNSAELIVVVTRKIDEFLELALTPIIMFVTGGITLAMIIGFLIFTAPQISIFIFGSIVLTYVFVGFITKKMLRKHSVTQATASVLVMSSLKEMIAGFREIKLKNLSNHYSQLHKEFDNKFRRSQASIRFYSQSPKFFVETVILFIVFLLAIFLMDNGFLLDIAPMMVMIALGLQKSLPYAQVVYSSYSLIEGGKASGLDVINLLSGAIREDFLGYQEVTSNMSFHNIEFSNVSFNYSKNKNTVIKNINLLINEGDRVGIVGSSGTGKSTFSNLLMGLIRPTVGSILVNGANLNFTLLKDWQQILSHVPQNLFIQNSTLAQNIAFGLPKEKIDLKRVNEVLLKVGLHEFATSMPAGVWASLGDDGGLISGGQRQRVCIARALYDVKAEILILDEPTSALNVELGSDIIDLVFSLKQFKVIVVITHNRSILHYCNKVIDFDNGSSFEGN